MESLPRYELIFEEDEMEGVYGVSLVSDPAIQIEAMQFSRTEKCCFSSDDFKDEDIDKLISKGEKVDLSKWVLIEEKEVSDDSVYSIDLASAITPTDSASEQDNEIFKIRYEYSPNTTSDKSRSFCIKMANANNVYRKEDLISSDANAGFGAGGADTYNIFLYKGGVNCKHFWNRKIYLQKNQQEMSVYEALKYIGGLDKANAAKAKLPVNPTEVKEVASSDNNYWKLSTELQNIKLTSEEKRILTSPVLLPEQNIYRNFDGEQCNVFLSADSIERLMINFSDKQYQKNSTIEHLDVIDGVLAFENWLVSDSKNDKANALGFDVPVGTWMMSMKLSKELWDDYVKTGKVKGFSIDSRLGVKKPQKNNKEKMKYSQMQELVLKQILLDADLKEFKLEDGTAVFAEALDVDMLLFDKDNVPMANFDGVVDAKTVKTDDKGVITSVEPVVAAEAPKAEVQAADESAHAAEAPNALQEDLDAAKKRIEELETENQELKAELVSIKEEAVQLAAQPRVEVNLNRITNTNEAPKVMTPIDHINRALEQNKK